MFVSTQMPAVNMGFPDVCIIPAPVPVPAPFVNVSFTSVAIPSIFNIFIWAMPAQNNLTVAAVSSLGGPGPGVASGAVFGGTRMLVSSVKTFYSGMPVNKCFGTTGQNGLPPFAVPFNCPGTQISPSQVTVMVLA